MKFLLKYLKIDKYNNIDFLLHENIHKESFKKMLKTFDKINDLYPNAYNPITKKLYKSYQMMFFKIKNIESYAKFNFEADNYYWLDVDMQANTTQRGKSYINITITKSEHYEKMQPNIVKSIKIEI